jgi:hypothetical protein
VDILSGSSSSCQWIQVVLSRTDLAGTATLTCSAPSRSGISCKCCGSGSVPQLAIPYAADDPVVGCVRGTVSLDLRHSRHGKKLHFIFADIAIRLFRHLAHIHSLTCPRNSEQCHRW